MSKNYTGKPSWTVQDGLPIYVGTRIYNSSKIRIYKVPAGFSAFVGPDDVRSDTFRSKYLGNVVRWALQYLDASEAIKLTALLEKHRAQRKKESR
jgi:hypothetical protein